MSINTFNKKLASSTVLTGVRHAGKNKYKKSKKAFITGFYKMLDVQTGFIYKGSVTDSNSGIFYPISFPNSYLTAPYGPDRVSDDIVSVVGNYNLTSGSPATGFLYTGSYKDTSLGSWISITPPFDFASNCIMHSVMNGIAVGNYGQDPTSLATVPLKPRVYAVLFNSRTNQYYKITMPEVSSISAYGIWHNSDSDYTIAGGYVANNVNRAYIMDWNEKSGLFSNFTSYKYNNSDSSKITHFDGITGLGKGKFNLTGDFVNENGPGAFFCTVNRHEKPKAAIWTMFSYPKSEITSGNTVIDNKAYGIYILDGIINGYVYKNKK
jgi:hypothetical protein